MPRPHLFRARLSPRQRWSWRAASRCPTSAPAPARPPRSSRSTRPGRSRCPRTGSSARSPASRSTRTTASGSCIARRRWSTTRRARCRIRRPPSAARPAPPVLQFDAEGNLLRSWGGPGTGYDWPEIEHGIYVDDSRQRLDRRQRAQGPPDPQVHPRRQVPAADRQGRANRAARTATNALGRPAHMEIDAAANELYVADGYRQPARPRARREHRRLQAPLGRVRQRAERRQAAALRSGAAARRSSSATRCTACGSRSDGLRLRVRPRQRPHPGVREERQVRDGVPRRARDAAERLGVGPRALARTPRRATSSWPTAPTAQMLTLERDTGKVLSQLRPPRAHGGRVQVGAQHRASTPRATSTRPRSAPGGARRNSARGVAAVIRPQAQLARAIRDADEAH